MPLCLGAHQDHAGLHVPTADGAGAAPVPLSHRAWGCRDSTATASCSSPTSEPSAGFQSAPLLFYSGHSGRLGDDTKPEQRQGLRCHALDTSPSSHLSPPHSACTVPVLLLLRVPRLGLVLVGGEGTVCESSPYPVTNYCTFTLTNSAFPEVGMVLEAQPSSRAQPSTALEQH